MWWLVIIQTTVNRSALHEIDKVGEGTIRAAPKGIDKNYVKNMSMTSRPITSFILHIALNQ